MADIRILLADDHAMVREGIKRLLELQPGMVVVAEAEEARGAVAQTQQFHPDIALIDVSMGEGGGARATREVRRLCPETRVIALTLHEDPAYLNELLEAGASGYVLKCAAYEELIRAIRVVFEGGMYVDPRLAGKLSTPGRPVPGAPLRRLELSARETEVMRLLAQGFTNKEISAQLGVSVKTVETYKARSMEKLGLRSRVDIVRIASERGWLPPR